MIEQELANEASEVAKNVLKLLAEKDANVVLNVGLMVAVFGLLRANRDQDGDREQLRKDAAKVAKIFQRNVLSSYDNHWSQAHLQ